MLIPPGLRDCLQLVDVSDDNLVEGRVAPNRFGCHAQGTGSCLLPSPLNRVRGPCPNDEPAAARRWLPLLENLQKQKPDQDWKALHGPTPAVMFPLSYQPGEIGFCDFTKVKGVEITLRGEPFPHLLAACGGVPKALRTLRLHHDRLIVVLGSDWACQRLRADGNGGHGRRLQYRRCPVVDAAKRSGPEALGRGLGRGGVATSWASRARAIGQSSCRKGFQRCA